VVHSVESLFEVFQLVVEVPPDIRLKRILRFPLFFATLPGVGLFRPLCSDLLLGLTASVFDRLQLSLANLSPVPKYHVLIQIAEQRGERPVLVLNRRVLQNTTQKTNEGLNKVIVVHEKIEYFPVEVHAVESNLT